MMKMMIWEIDVIPLNVKDFFMYIIVHPRFFIYPDVPEQC